MIYLSFHRYCPMRKKEKAVRRSTARNCTGLQEQGHHYRKITYNWRTNKVLSEKGQENTVN